MSKQMTVKQFAELHNLADATANSVLVFLREKGLVTVCGTVRKPSLDGAPVKGKPANVYEIPDQVTIDLLAAPAAPTAPAAEAEEVPATAQN